MIDGIHGVPFDRIDDACLVREYESGMRHCFNAMFGHNARRLQDSIGSELVRRGITEIPNVFGAITIKADWSTH